MHVTEPLLQSNKVPLKPMHGTDALVRYISSIRAIEVPKLEDALADDQTREGPVSYWHEFRPTPTPIRQHSGMPFWEQNSIRRSARMHPLFHMVFSLLHTFVWAAVMVFVTLPGNLLRSILATLHPKLAAGDKGVIFYEGTIRHVRQRPKRNAFT